jgi:protein-S-isoprenylcysteine O-methyltransferase Ste14
MRRTRAALGSALFFLLAPGVVGGFIPWWITRWQMRQPIAAWLPLLPLRAAGLVLLAISVPVLVHAFWRFTVEGLGTPAPVAPTERLVVGGLYRYVRNPMYLAVLGTIVGQALLLAQFGLLIYAGVILTAFVTFVRWYEEPTLTRQFGAEYEAYRRAVPGWWPRWSPWTREPDVSVRERH